MDTRRNFSGYCKYEKRFISRPLAASVLCQVSLVCQGTSSGLEQWCSNQASSFTTRLPLVNLSYGYEMSGKRESATTRPIFSFWFIQKLVLVDSLGDIWWSQNCSHVLPVWKNWKQRLTVYFYNRLTCALFQRCGGLKMQHTNITAV